MLTTENSLVEQKVRVAICSLKRTLLAYTIQQWAIQRYFTSSLGINAHCIPKIYLVCIDCPLCHHWQSVHCINFWVCIFTIPMELTLGKLLTVGKWPYMAISLQFLHCTLANCSAVYCNRSCLWVCVCVCVIVGVFVCGSVTTITRNCVHRSSPNWVCR